MSEKLREMGSEVNVPLRGSPWAYGSGSMRALRHRPFLPPSHCLLPSMIHMVCANQLSIEWFFSDLVPRLALALIVAAGTVARSRRLLARSRGRAMRTALLRHLLARPAELCGEILKLRQPVTQRQNVLSIVDVDAWTER
jgi:hypothetical protein